MRIVIIATTIFMLAQPAHAGILSGVKNAAKSTAEVVFYVPKKVAYYGAIGMIYLYTKSLYPLLLAQALLEE